jgi:hypothetical protein
MVIEAFSIEVLQMTPTDGHPYFASLTDDHFDLTNDIWLSPQRITITSMHGERHELNFAHGIGIY